MCIIQFRTENSSAKTFDTIDQLYSLYVNNYIEYNDIICLQIENVTFDTYLYLPHKLEVFYISNCKRSDNLGVLPDSVKFVEMTNCFLLTLDHLFVPDYEYNKLETLNVSYNRLTKLSINFPNKLISLNVSYNDIKKLPNRNCFPKDIQYIDLSSNQLVDLPEWILDLNDDTQLNLMPNHFWFNKFSNISFNIKVEDYHINIATRFFNTQVLHKLNYIRTLNQIAYDDYAINQIEYIPKNKIKPQTKTTAEIGQNVHHSSIQDSFCKSVFVIMNYDVSTYPNYLKRVWYYYIFDGLNIFDNICFINIIRSNCRLKSIVSKCSVTYGEIFEKIWNISKTHENKKEIRKILRDEITAGNNMCFTGKVTRLVNSLSGFIDGIQIGYSENEQINNAVIATMRRCESNTSLNIKDEVQKILDGLLVPKDKQDIWLDAL